MSGPKSGNTPRRAASALSKVSTPPTTAPAPPAARSAKSSKPSKVVHIKLPRDQLKVFPHEQRLRKASHAKASPLSTSKVISSDESPPAAAVKPEPDSTSTLSGEHESASPVKDAQSEAASTTKTSIKRDFAASTEGDDSSKDKAKTQTLKRRKLDPSKPDGRTAAAKAMKSAAGITTAAHKLGPKANQGIINAGLRALDRTGKPCRKWEKTGFRVKSFTGRVWEVPSWRTPNGRAFGSENERGISSKDNSSSNVGSDKSPAINPSNQASSPVHEIATPA